MEKAAAYIRVSTTDQVDNGVSLEVQAERIESYCKAHNLELVATYQDNGISASKPLEKREAGAALLAALERGEVKNVVSLKLDRLFRNALDCLTVAEAWDKKGVALHLVDLGGNQALNTASPMGKFFLTLTGAFGELERNMIAERTRQALNHKKECGQVYGPLPLGFTREGADLVEDPGELATVSRIQALRLEGVSYNRIAATLNAENVPTKRGGKWYACTVEKIIKNSLYQAA